MKKIWLSYDLGIPGDYDGLFAMLDELEAKECGLNVAVFDAPLDADEEPEGVLSWLDRYVREHVSLDDSSRIYVIFRAPTGDKVLGHWLVGKRRPARWAGHARKFVHGEVDAG